MMQTKHEYNLRNNVNKHYYDIEDAFEFCKLLRLKQKRGLRRQPRSIQKRQFKIVEKQQEEEKIKYLNIHDLNNSSLNDKIIIRIGYKEVDDSFYDEETEIEYD